MSGSLAPYAAEYEGWLVDRGFVPLALPKRMRQLDHLSRWLEREGLSAGQLTQERVEQYLATRRAAGYLTCVSGLSMRLPLAYLGAIGVVPAARPALADRPVERLLEDYCVYLTRERGLAPQTIRKSERVARLFLEERERIDGLALERLTPAEVSEFLARECPRRSISGARTLVANFRPLLRYLHVSGRISTPLRWAVPGVADLRDRSLLRGLEPAAVAGLLESCDRGRTTGCRDYAILLLLVR